MYGVPPPRGRIYDRAGNLLADNVPVFSIFVIPELTDDVDATLAEIAALVEVSDAEIDAFHTLASESTPHSPIRVKPHISPAERAVIEVNRHSLSGVQVRPDTVRHYPYGDVMAHAVGSVRRKTAEDIRQLDRLRYRRTQFVGKRGVEAFYEHSLHGHPGSRQVEVDAHGREQRELGRNPPVPGHNLTLHLDAALQVAAAEALGERRGAVVAIDPRSGGILAMVSEPGYDPNLFVTGMDPAVYNGLANSPRKPLFNRATNGRYAPGSTFKPVVGLAALAAGVTDWERTIRDQRRIPAPQQHPGVPGLELDPGRLRRPGDRQPSSRHLPLIERVFLRSGAQTAGGRAATLRRPVRLWPGVVHRCGRMRCRGCCRIASGSGVHGAKAGIRATT